MEYHVLLDPARLYNFHIPVVQVVNALQSNNSNTGGGFARRPVLLRSRPRPREIHR
jgi:Cu/Ag efflux pump CusA